MECMGLMEDAMLAALKAVSGVKTLEAYSGQIDASRIQEIAQRYPCLYVVTNMVESVAMDTLERNRMLVDVLVGDRNLRGDTAARRGDVRSPGIYALMAAADACLTKKTLVQGWTPLRFVRAEPAIYAPSEHILVYGVQYQTFERRGR